MQINSLEMMQWSGCVLGVLGSFLLARNDTQSGWGFAAYLVSNGAWLAYGIASETNALIVQNLIFTLISGFGIWRWFIKPRISEVHSKD